MATCLCTCDRSRATSGVHDYEQKRDDQSKPIPHRTGEEVRDSQHVHMNTDELRPGHGLLALRGWRNAMALEDIAHCLVADRVSQMVQGALNAIITPGTVLSCHAD